MVIVVVLTHPVLHEEGHKSNVLANLVHYIIIYLQLIPIYRTGRKFRGVFNFAFFVGGCRTRKLKPAKGFVYACEIVTHPNSTKFTTREIFQIRQNIELHENLNPRNFLPVR